MMRSNVRFISVFCNNTQRAIPRYQNLVKQLGRELVKNNFGLVCSGNNQGLMGILTDSVLEVGGEVIGIVKADLKNTTHFNDKIPRVIETENETVYKNRLTAMVDGFIGLPGLNSLEELTNLAINTKSGKENKSDGIKPCVVLNVDGFFNGFKNQLSRCFEEGFITPKHFSAIYFTDKIPDSLTFITKYEALTNAIDVEGGASHKKETGTPLQSMHSLVDQVIHFNKKISPCLVQPLISNFFKPKPKKEKQLDVPPFSGPSLD